MLEGIDALIALEQYGTVSEAAIRLRLTQSAVSKRIQSLQRAVRFKLVEPDGRRIRLTAPAIDFLERARPLIADLRGLTSPRTGDAASNFTIALADSIASSWGPAVLGKALKGLAGIAVRLHAHRSVLVTESVRLGRYHIGLSTDLPAAKDLIHYPVIDEPLVLVSSGFKFKTDKRSRGNQPLITIEPSSATWRAIEPQIRERHATLLERPLIPVETFSATMQMVKAGFGDGLMPLGLIIAMKLDARCYREISGLNRHISLITRKTVNQLASFQLLRERLVMESARYFSGKARPRA
jgi:DNA-binding transcriptional LysR family regulator